MSRDRQQMLDVLAEAARLTAFHEPSTTDGPPPPPATWRDVLFAASGPHWAPSRQADADRQLLIALADELAQADAHLETVPARLHTAWLEDILGIPRLPVLPDRVVAAATVDPKLAPAVIPLDTRLRGGKDAFGNERRYRTVDALTAHGAQLAEVRVLLPGGPSAGTPGVILTAPDFPITPEWNDHKAVGPPAPHVIRISSPALGFTGGDMSVTLSFEGADTTALDAFRDNATWRYPRADGVVADNVAGGGTGQQVTLSLRGGCADPAGGDPWVEGVISPNQEWDDLLTFTNVKVQVTRTAIPVDAAFVNGGEIDPTKVFEPFGISAAVGDAFFVRSDEALAKELFSLDINVGEFTVQSGGDRIMLRADQVEELRETGYGRADEAPQLSEEGQHIIHQRARSAVAGSSRPLPKIRWQHLYNNVWETLEDLGGSFGSGSVTDLNKTGSELSEVSGQKGRYVRAFLSNADLGWQQYQRDLATFATEAVQSPAASQGMPAPLVPAKFRDLTISYTTTDGNATRVESLSGWRHSVKPDATGTWRPFRRDADNAGGTGMVAIGLDVDDSAAGSSMSLYIDLDSAAPCGTTSGLTGHWQWWHETDGWQELLVADGTGRLREAGLVRFVVPATWGRGCEDLNADTARWLRFVTSEPERLGVIRAVIPDAVLAEFVSSAADPGQDPSSVTALPAGTIKGTVTPIPGIKKVTNAASVKGRGPEGDADYGRRASAVARHRNRAITPWDYEQMVTLQFPEVAAVRCLAHTNSDGDYAPGAVGLVIIPDQPDVLKPRPSVSLAGRVTDALRPLMPMGATIATLCPRYEPVTVIAHIKLRPGVAALTGKQVVTAALERLLHPTGTTPTRWGVDLYASSLIAAIEGIAQVEGLDSFEMRDKNNAVTELITVDACRGLYHSSGKHQLNWEESL